MRFVKVMDIKHGETYIDITKVITFWQDKDKKHTVVRFSDNGYIQVEETPEQILIKLPTIGG